MVSGGRRDGTGRPASHLHTVPSDPQTLYGYRVLVGLEKPEFREGDYSPRNPVVFLTVATVFFLVTRLLMTRDALAAVDWAELHLGSGWIGREAEPLHHDDKGFQLNRQERMTNLCDGPCQPI